MSTPRRYLMATFQDGDSLGDGLRLALSLDGLRWRALADNPLVVNVNSTGGNVFRDPSILWHAGSFHVVFTSDICVDQRGYDWRCGNPVPGSATRFGYVHSTDLVTWPRSPRS